MLDISYLFFSSFFHKPGLISEDMNDMTLTALVARSPQGRAESRFFSTAGGILTVVYAVISVT